MITITAMGTAPCGLPVNKARLENASGAYVEISTIGGCIMKIVVPDNKGVLGDVTLGYDTVEGMVTSGGYMGYLIGRVGNRIGKAQFVLDGKTYSLAANDGQNHLHGGNRGYDKRVWGHAVVGDTLVLTHESPDGDEGYPGAVSVKVTYAFSDDNALSIHYQATTTAATPINLTNHVYFNLEGPGAHDLSGHKIQIDADTITAVADGQCIPTGVLMPVQGTPLDLTSPRDIVEGLALEGTCTQMQFGQGYDHNYCLNGWDGTLKTVCQVTAGNGRTLTVETDQPGLQFYSGNMISPDAVGKAGAPYHKRQGFCLESQHYPDSPNQPTFPSCILQPGDVYDTTTVYTFGTI